jgi:hypothetical protein
MPTHLIEHVSSERLCRHLPPVGLALALALSAVWFWLAIPFGLSSAQAQTLCVKPGGGDGCQSHIGDALGLAQPGDTILVAAGTYTENVMITQTVILQGGWNPDFTVRDLAQYTTTIIPTDTTQSVVAVQGQFADTTAVAPTLDGFTITGGQANLGSNHGGGLRIVDSDASVISNTIKGNSAFLLGGGVWVQRGAPRLENNRIEDNLSAGPAQDAFGGGVALENSQATLAGNIVAGNVISGSGYGAGLDVNGGAVSLAGNTLSENGVTVVGYGGGMAVRNGATTLLEGEHMEANHVDFGGGVYADGSTLLIQEATIIANKATRNIPGQGGGLYILDSAITVTNSTIRGNSTASGGGIYNADSDISVRDSTIISNNAVFDGGGIYSGGVTILDNVTVMGNEAGDEGGGIFNSSIGSLVVSQSSVLSNTVDDSGGGIAVSGPITLTGVTIQGNIAAADGGGLFNDDDTATLTNVTISGNAAAGNGGGVFNNSGVMTVTNATVTSNEAGLQGHGLYNDEIMTLKNTIVAGNGDENCADNDTLVSAGHNLEDADSCGFDPAQDDLIDADPLLAPLADNGGPTLTHALLAGSPAIDTADNGLCPNSDQRGLPRPIDGNDDGLAICDMGAFEFDPAFFSLYLPVVRN